MFDGWIFRVQSSFTSAFNNLMSRLLERLCGRLRLPHMLEGVNQ